MNRPRIRPPSPGEAVNGTILRRRTAGTRTCPVCMKPLPPGGRTLRRYCSSKCRLLAWAVDALAEALQEGRAEGLRERARRLGKE